MELKPCQEGVKSRTKIERDRMVTFFTKRELKNLINVLTLIVCLTPSFYLNGATTNVKGVYPWLKLPHLYEDYIL